MKCQLSISILVSNHIDTVRKCLESVKPLLDRLRAELIVVDTGSTDGSIDVAKEYTDKIIPFVWCNDFSAARNVGLKAAHGEWFLYLDDDEWFEDVSEIINFFETEKYMDYGRAFYVQRNYEDYEGTRYTDAHVLRMFQIVEGTHFKFRIHELVSPELDPLKVFSTYVHHYGYIGKSEEKHQRNATLLRKELKDNPNEMRMFAQLVNEYCVVKNYGAVIDLKEALDRIERGSVNDALYCYVHAKIAECYFHLDRIQDAITYTRWLFEQKLCNTITEAHLYIVLINAYAKPEAEDNECEMLLYCFEKYMNRIKKQPIDEVTFSKTALLGMGKVFRDDYMEEVIHFMINATYGKAAYNKLVEILREYHISIREETEQENVAVAKEMEEMKKKLLVMIQTLVDDGQIEAAYQAVNQAIAIMGEDEELMAVRQIFIE